MGTANDMLEWYLNRSAVFADFINGSIYDGNQIISPQALCEIQRVYYETLQDRYTQKHKHRRARDCAKALYRNGHFAILAIENQDKCNFCMPLRLLEYDVTELLRQLRRLRAHYKEQGGLDDDEYLSGIKKTDRFIPVTTFLFYHGKGHWSGPAELREMLSQEALDDTLKEVHVNYRMKIVNLTDLDENNFQTGLRELIAMMKRRDSKTDMLAYQQAHADRFQNLEEDTYDMICMMLHLNILQETKENYLNSERRTLNMCKAMDDLINDSKMLGKEEGLREGKKEAEAKMGLLIDRLFTDNRISDIRKIATSPRVRNRLYREYGL